MKSKELTKAEEQVMRYLWEMKKGFLKDIVEKFPEPRPAYTTVSTVTGVLVRKGFIGFRSYGKIREYYPLVAKTDYFNNRLKSLVNNFFNGSAPQFAMFFANQQLDLSELEEVQRLIESKIKEIKK